MLRINCLALFTGLIFVSFATAQDDFKSPRTWTDQSGKFSVKAKLIKFEKGIAYLEKQDGTTLEVEFRKLSDADKQWIRKFNRQKNGTSKTSEGKDQKADGPKSDSKKEMADKSTASKSSNSSKAWNQWRGPDRNAISTDKNLLKSWESKKPSLLWSAQGLGRGMSSVAITDKMIFTLGNRNGKEQLIALKRSDGSEVWSADVGAGRESNSTPTVDGDRIYALGRAGDLICAETKTGKVVWQKSLPKDFGGKMMSQWGFSESPLVDGDKLICTPGGESAMIVALNKKDGSKIWSTAMKYGGRRGTDGAGYASIVISNAGGVKQYITLVGRGLISVNAKDGSPLWQYEKIANSTANVPTPIVFGDYVFCSSGYNDGGSALLKIVKRGRQLGIQEVYYKRAGELQNHHGGMIKIGDYIYMGHGHNKGFPTCIDIKSGRSMWERTRGPGSGSAAVVAADGHLYFRYEDGTMALIEANPKSYKLKGSFRIASVDAKSWPHPVVFDKKLYLRDAGKLHCYDLSANQ